MPVIPEDRDDNIVYTGRFVADLSDFEFITNDDMDCRDCGCKIESMPAYCPYYMDGKPKRISDGGKCEHKRTKE